jgi:demethoxyubiquinone hydroxylase (CLK1/Coq7/Cat5 family)
VRKPTVLKTPVWRAAGFAALLGLGLISNPVQSALASGG